METTPPKEYALFDEPTRANLAAYRDANKLSNSELGRELGFHPTQVSRYLSGKPDWNITRFEGVVRDVLASAANRELEAKDLFETSASRQINGALEDIRKTNDVGAIVGPAGIGKTRGIDLYLLVNPACLKMTVTEDQCDGDGLVGLLFTSVDTGTYDNRTNRSQWLRDKFHHSNRLLIFDNAHLIKKRGWDWIFNFQDATDCPIALVGNPEMVERLKLNDQWFSRIGLNPKIRLTDAESVVDEMIRRFIGKGGDVLQELALQVVETKGHLRALKKQLKLARQIAQKTNRDLVTCFRAAHLQLIREYKLQ
jgi:DNA transposition AAA+ family ATPase